MKALHATDACDQHLVIVHVSEQILRFLQRADARGRTRSAQLARDFHRIPQLLHRDAHLVEPIGQVQARGVLDRFAKPDRALRAARNCAAATRLGSRAVGPGALAGGGRGAMTQLVDVDAADPRAHLGVHALPFFANHLPELRDGAPRSVGLRRQRLEHFERDVELAHRAERAGQTTHRPLELPPARSGCDERQRFAKTAGRDTRLVDEHRVALLRAGQRRWSGRSVAGG